jgi:hypothetical protein
MVGGNGGLDLMYCCVWVGRDRGNGMLKNKCIVA